MDEQGNTMGTDTQPPIHPYHPSQEPSDEKPLLADTLHVETLTTNTSHESLPNTDNEEHDTVVRLTRFFVDISTLYSRMLDLNLLIVKIKLLEDFSFVYSQIRYFNALFILFVQEHRYFTYTVSLMFF